MADNHEDTSISIQLDEATELSFRVVVDAPSPCKPSYRLVCEARDGMSIVLQGSPSSDGFVSVVVPALKGIMSEGASRAKLEVIVDDKFFVPLELDMRFVQPVTVKAEVVSHGRASSVPVAVKSKKPVVASLVSSKGKRTLSELFDGKKK